MKQSLKKKIDSKRSKPGLRAFAARFSGSELKELKAHSIRLGISINSLVRISVSEMLEKNGKALK